MADDDIRRVAELPFWRTGVKIWPLSGGITNRNYGVEQEDGQRFAVRLGHDIPLHGVMRFNELAAASAAAQAGISPKVFFAEPGVLITKLLPGRTLTPEEIRLPQNRQRIVALLKLCHAGKFLRGPLLAFWVFHINRSYAADLARDGSRIAAQLPALTALNEQLERRVGPTEIVFGHNDLLAGNIFDDGARLWLLDWDYAGFNSPLFDLANLSSNNGFSPAEETQLLQEYYGGVTEAMWRGFLAMKCASLLREALWSAISERHSKVDFDYVAYTNEYLSRLEQAVTALV
jgi:thiamine kinase-like enzyme